MTDLTVTVLMPKELKADLAKYRACKRTVTEGAAMGIEAALRDHFQELQGRPRKDGFQSSGFWFGSDGNSVAEQISGHVIHDDGTASVTIDSPELRHKIDGGTIAAKDYGHKYLTIPANNEAAQAPQGARSFAAEVEWVPHPDGGVRPALVAAGNYVRTSRSRKTGEVKRKVTHDETKANAGIGDVLFWLVRKVTHKPMADALPDDQTLGDAAREAALDALDALLAAKGEAA
jgi:hypothetical protein